jgi:hypothetical protein
MPDGHRLRTRTVRAIEDDDGETADNFEIPLPEHSLIEAPMVVSLERTDPRVIFKTGRHVDGRGIDGSFHSVREAIAAKIIAFNHDALEDIAAEIIVFYHDALSILWGYQQVTYVHQISIVTSDGRATAVSATASDQRSLRVRKLSLSTMNWHFQAFGMASSFA